MKKIILITGSNRGIGYGIAELYAINKNFNNNLILMTSRDKQHGEKAVHKLISDYPDIKKHIIYHELDIRSHHSIKKIFNYVKDNFNQIDVLYNNAGVLHREIPHDREERKKQFIQIFETNFWGPMHLANAFLPLFEERNLGHIVNVSSELGKISLSSKELCERFLDPHISFEKLNRLYKEYEHAFIEQTIDFNKAWYNGFRNYSCYPVSKMFLNVYTLILARLMKKKDLNIKINSCTPGWCDTRMGGQNAIRSYLKGSETPYWVGNFPDDRNDNLSGNFYKEKNKIIWSGVVIDESNIY